MLSPILAIGDQNLCDKNFLNFPLLKNKKFNPIIKNKPEIMSNITAICEIELNTRMIRMITVANVQAFGRILSSFCNIN